MAAQEGQYNMKERRPAVNSICKDIFRAIHEGKWLSIEYRNKDGEITKYWIGIKALNPVKRILRVEGLHLSQCTSREFLIYIDSIVSSGVVDGSYCPVNEKLLEDIRVNPANYQELFGNVANLKILNYLTDCNRLDTVPYQCDYALLEYFDEDRLRQRRGTDGPAGAETAETETAGAAEPVAEKGHLAEYRLTDKQFREIVRQFQYRTQKKTGSLRIKQLCLNVMSIHFREGLYVLAYRRMNLDVKARLLRPEQEVTVCREFTVDGSKQSARRFLDADDYYLLDDFEHHAEEIKDRITASNRQIKGVDDMPYLIALGMNGIDLNREYNGIIDLYNSEKNTYPLRAFFGDLVARPVRTKEYPLALLDRNANLDQLLAVHNAVKYPLAYIQGPPGTGKTQTIINTIMTAFFNGKTVLFCSYNNHPIDGVFDKLRSIRYRGRPVPFPIVRLGNQEKTAEALVYMREIYEKTKNVTVFEGTLEKNKEDKIRRTRELTALLKKREEILDLQERREAIEKLLSSNRDLRFHAELEGRQLQAIKERLNEIGEVHDQDAKALVQDDEEEFAKYLNYTSAKFIKRLGEEKNRELLDLLYMEDADKQMEAFERYLGKTENLEKFQRIFPVVATTCISAHKLGDPKPHFDMVIMDEASQCGTATALIPIVRGESLMLVGDPQQLNPVSVLDPKDNLILRKRYGVSAEYDYIDNSIYKVYLACDSVSDEVLLRCHYRCHRKIIDFNNKKYYNNKLEILTKSQEKEPLIYMDVVDGGADERTGDGKSGSRSDGTGGGLAGRSDGSEGGRSDGTGGGLSGGTGGGLSGLPGIKNTSPAEAEEIVRFAKSHKDKKIGVITPFANQKEYISGLLKENGLTDVACGTVHAFQGDEKDVILFSLALTDKTHEKTYQWLKNYKELINVAVSRAKDQLVILGSSGNLERLHRSEEKDDIYELVEYVKSRGTSQVTERTASSRALGIKPYSTETEEAFLQCLNHALGNILYNEYENRKYVVHKEVAISQVFMENPSYSALFYSGRFDFVVYERTRQRRELPVLAIELDGKEHAEDELVRVRDEKKAQICREHGFELIRIENTYARRYNYIKEILIKYFGGRG